MKRTHEPASKSVLFIFVIFSTCDESLTHIGFILLKKVRNIFSIIGKIFTNTLFFTIKNNPNMNNPTTILILILISMFSIFTVTSLTWVTSILSLIIIIPPKYESKRYYIHLALSYAYIYCTRLIKTCPYLIFYRIIYYHRKYFI